MKSALLLQKKVILERQIDELNALFSKYLPGYSPEYATGPDDVQNHAKYDLIITAFPDFFEPVMRKIAKPGHLHFTSSGTDKLSDYPDLDLDGVLITSSAGVNAVTIAEHILGVMLAFAKNLHIYRDQQQKTEWRRMWHSELNGLTAGVIGLGNIGEKTSRLLSALGMEVIGCNRTPKNVEGIAHCYPLMQLDEFLSKSDYAVLCLPLTEETRNLADKHFFEMMKPGSFFINVSRGELVNEADLISALEAGKPAGAALDVFEHEPLSENHPFWSMGNVILTPHVAGTTQKYMENMFRILAQKV